MKWTAKDVTIFMEQKQYIDTAIIPLFPVSFRDSIKDAANSSEFIEYLVSRLEHQFKGRVLLLPGIPYFMESSDEEKWSLLHNWIEQLSSQGNFKHIIFISTDSHWKSIAEVKEDFFLWIPSIPLEHLEEKYRQSVIDDQVKQLLNFFIRKWQKFD